MKRKEEREVKRIDMIWVVFLTFLLRLRGIGCLPLSILRYDPKRVADTWAVFEKLVEEV